MKKNPPDKKKAAKKPSKKSQKIAPAPRGFVAQPAPEGEVDRIGATLAAREAAGLNNKGPKKLRAAKNTKNIQDVIDTPPIDLDKFDKEKDENKRYRMLSILRKEWDWESEFAAMFIYRMGLVHLSIPQIAGIIGYEETNFCHVFKTHEHLIKAYDLGKANCLRMTAATMHRNAQLGDTKAGMFILESLDRAQYGKKITVDQKQPVQFVMPKDLYDDI